MKYLVIIILAGTMVFAESCRKKDEGFCYCDYVSGDKKKFDLNGMDRSAAMDSCAHLDRNANAFGGECELE